MKSMMRKVSIGLVAFFAALQAAFAAPTISDVRVTPVAPWGMAIDYTVSGAVACDTNITVCVTATGGGKTYTAKNLTGDTRCVNGAHRMMWNMAKDGITATVANSTVSVKYYWLNYCVIDLSSGANATNYPVSYLDAEPSGGFNTLEYKTTKFVLKRVAAGSFKMQDAASVTLTKPFYMGLFEVTQKQWSLVKGSNPSNFEGDARPVEEVSYNMIRGSSEGAKWPASNAVDAWSFLGKLRARTGLDFDLPTEAQWEYACRAGTTTKYSYGDTANGAYYMWYSSNAGSRTHEVGTKKPNPWGFYDLHGNVFEWCLDRNGAGAAAGTDPKGSSWGSGRVLRGGGWNGDAGDCASSSRDSLNPSSVSSVIGFRLVRPLSD